MSADIILFVPRPNPNREKPETLEQFAVNVLHEALGWNEPSQANAFHAPEKDPA